MFSCLSPPMPAAMKASMLLLLPAVVNAWSIDRVKDAALEPTKNDLDSEMPLRRNPEHEGAVCGAEHARNVFCLVGGVRARCVGSEREKLQIPNSRAPHCI